MLYRIQTVAFGIGPSDCVIEIPAVEEDTQQERKPDREGRGHIDGAGSREGTDGRMDPDIREGCPLTSKPSDRRRKRSIVLHIHIYFECHFLPSDVLYVLHMSSFIIWRMIGFADSSTPLCVVTLDRKT